LIPEVIKVDKSVIFQPFFFEGEITILIATPILNRQKVKVGTDLVLFNTKNLRSIIEDHSGMGQTGEVMLVIQEDGQPRPLFPPRRKISTQLLSRIVTDFKNADYLESDSIHPASPSDVFTVRKVKFTDWTILFRIDIDELNETPPSR